MILYISLIFISVVVVGIVSTKLSDFVGNSIISALVITLAMCLVSLIASSSNRETFTTEEKPIVVKDKYVETDGENYWVYEQRDNNKLWKPTPIKSFHKTEKESYVLVETTRGPNDWWNFGFSDYRVIKTYYLNENLTFGLPKWDPEDDE